MSYYDARLAEFEAMRADSMYRETIYYNGMPYHGIAPSRQRDKTMRETNYMEQVPDGFEMRDIEFTASGINIHSTYISQGITYQIHAVILDSKEPTVILRANRKQ